MSFTQNTARVAATALALLLPALAQAQMIVEDAYARAASPVAQSGAAFMKIVNQGDRDDRVIAASSDVAQRVELHSHVAEADGVMRMVKVEEGFAIPAGQTHVLARGGDHVMFLGLTRPLLDGETLELTLTFEHAEPLTLTVPVDLQRQDMPAQGGMDHGGHGHGTMSHGTGG